MNMDPQQALQILAQYFVTKTGLSPAENKAVAIAWDVLNEAVKPKAPQIVADKKKAEE